MNQHFTPVLAAFFGLMGFWSVELKAQSPELLNALDILDAQSGWNTMLDGIPFSYNFSYDGGNNYIGDGGSDMYDNGNYLSINGSSINYTSGSISSVGETHYFTLQKPRVFMLVADANAMSSFEVSGSLGADGGGSASGWSLEGDQACFKRVCQAGDASVNHLFALPFGVTGEQAFDSYTNNDNHSISFSAESGLFVFILWGGENAFCYDEAQSQTVLENLASTGVVELLELGCMDPTACNYNAEANQDDSSCAYAQPELDCSGGCLSDVDGDGICDAFEIAGCTDPASANYQPEATDDDGSCGPLGLVVDTLLFVPATIDSTRTGLLGIVNQLNTAQTVSVQGLESPFYAETTVEVGATDTAFLNIAFSPTNVDVFEVPLVLTGSAFGADEVLLVGEGTLPQGELLVDTLDFGSVSVNSYATEPLPFASIGIGSLVIDSVVSSSPLVFGPTNFVIAEGDTSGVPITFYSEFSGVYDVDITIFTSDPFNPVHQAHCAISAISEVGGEVCGTWSLINSPYLLVDHVVVPQGCALTIEPGVVIDGNSNDMEVFGQLHANGTADQPVDMRFGEFLSHAPGANVVLRHTELTETNECLFSDIDIVDILENNPYSHDSLEVWLDQKGTLYPFDLDWYQANNFFYIEDTLGLEDGQLHTFLQDTVQSILDFYTTNEFVPTTSGPDIVVYTDNLEGSSVNDWTLNWSEYMGTSYASQDTWTDLYEQETPIYNCGASSIGNGYLQLEQGSCYSSGYTRLAIESPILPLLGHEVTFDWTFDASTSYWSDTRYLVVQYKIDNGQWTTLESYSNPSTGWSNYSFHGVVPQNSSSVQFRMEYRFRYYGTFRMDNAQLTIADNDNLFWPNSDLVTENVIGLEELTEFINSPPEEPGVPTMQVAGYTFEQPLSGPEEVYFVKANYASNSPENWDQISPGVALFRNNQNGLFNPMSQNGWENHIEGTLWGPAYSQNLSQYTSYWQDAICNAFGNCSIGNAIPGQAMSLYIPETQEFHIVQFHSWTCCQSGGGFAYTRTKVGPYIGGAVVNEPQGVVDNPGDFEKFKTLSTGGLTLEHSTFSGDFHTASYDSIAVVMHNSVLSKNNNRTKYSHGLGVYAPHLTLVLDSSSVLGHDMDGVHLEGDHVHLESMGMDISGNGHDGADFQGSLDWTSSNDVVANNGGHGMRTGGDVAWTADSTAVDSNGLDGLSLGGSLAWEATYCIVEENDGSGLTVGGSMTWDASHNAVVHNGGDGIRTGFSLGWMSHENHIAHNGEDGLDIGGNAEWESFHDVLEFNGSEGLTAGGSLILDADSTICFNNGSDGLEAFGSGSDVTLYQCWLHDNGGDGIRLTGSGGDLESDYSFIRDNNGDAVEMGSSGNLRMDNCLLGYNGGYGINSSGSVDLNYMNVLHNGSYGIRTSQFSTVDNSIVWFNGGVPQMITDNTYAVSYTNVQGINALLTSTDFAWGNGCIGTDPVLAGDMGHLDPYSPCVDGGMPWEQDAHIPYGLGSSRADMGMYGGPSNEYWGGQAPPDGAVQITDVFDIPQDQGGFVGMHFTASPFDFGGLGFNVTHYSIWRDLALGSDVPAEVGDGNWEQIGEVPAQGFGQYGYTAATLVDAYPGEEACLTSFIVIAHTTDDNIYWVSEVAAACSEDNLAPAEPELEGLVLADGDEEAVAVLSWAAPEEEDYAYTTVSGNNGFLGTVTNGDTALVDPSILPGTAVSYEAAHVDIHGNVSDHATILLQAPLGLDIIPLHAGWNLVSSDRIPENGSLDALMDQLSPENLQYVIGFNAGVQFYNPNGLPFLNTLNGWQVGMGHWIRVAQDDTLRVQGERLNSEHTPALLEGWNLVGYAAEDPAAPGDVFADLEAEGDLLYVTGFDQGVQVYDPNGLSFLNTLTEMRNGFGYWVKSAVATEGDVLAPLSDDVLPAAKPSPRYDVVNGTSTLGDHAGEFVDVLDGWGTVVARLPILEGGHLMTTALFGDDPATGIEEGLAEGDVLHFAFRGNMANETLVFDGNMAHKTLALTFDELEAGLSVFPNPAVDMTTVRVHAVEAGLATLEVTDVQGRVVLRQDLSLAAGVQALTLDVDALEGGAYNVELHQGTTPLGTSRLVVLD